MLAQVLVDSARTTAMLFTILIGALIFANFVNFTSMPEDLKNYVAQFELSPMTVIFMICFIYVLLGTAMEELSMILLTVPVLFPLVVHLGFDPLWFGVLVVVVVEIGLDQPAGGNEHLRAEDTAAGSVHRHHLPGRLPVRRGRCHPARDPDRAAGPLNLAASSAVQVAGVRPALRVIADQGQHVRIDAEAEFKSAYRL